MRLAISSLGMISSVGRDVITSCASIRAGITRPSEIDYYQILDDEDAVSIPIIGHPIRAYTEGFYLIGLWIRIAQGCFEDLRQHGNLPDRSDTTFWQETGFILVTPIVDEERFQLPEPISSERIKEVYGYGLLNVLQFPILQAHLNVVCMGHAGTAVAIGQAAQRIYSSQLQRVIVLAVDSYLDPLTLEWLGHHRRLKIGENPTGLAPGEAGACFLIESENEIQCRKAPIQAIIKGVAVGEERKHYFTEEVNNGIELSNVIGQVIPDKKLFTGSIIADLNGEYWRAYELGSAIVRLGNRLGEMSSFVLPSESLGETGAASGAIAVCVAVRSFVRGYALNDEALITLSSEYGKVGAIYVAKQ
jgi:3-oxoacyl-[acyl-carrier-protein] synthase-1